MRKREVLTIETLNALVSEAKANNWGADKVLRKVFWLISVNCEPLIQERLDEIEEYREFFREIKINEKVD